MCMREQSAGDDGSTQALKPMGRVNQSLKQRTPVAQQNGDLSPQKIIKKNKTKKNLCQFGFRLMRTHLLRFNHFKHIVTKIILNNTG